MKFSSFSVIFLISVISESTYQMVTYPSDTIIGGSEAKPHSAPYIVSIKIKMEDESNDGGHNKDDKYMHYCGGAILNRHWIITAAHCVPSDAVVARFEIHAGCHDVRGKEKTVQKRQVDYYIKHELYVGGVSPYDIALIYTKEPFKWNRSVKPINLPKNGVIPTGIATLYGWGSTSTTLIPSFPKKLQTIDVPILDLALCEQVLGRSPLHETNICTGPLSGGKSVCTSDSGGPLVQASNSENAVKLIGIVSWGRIPCGLPNSPSVYTRVSSFTDWIYKQMEIYK